MRGKQKKTRKMGKVPEKVKSYVKKEISRNIETKYVITNFGAYRNPSDPPVVGFPTPTQLNTWNGAMFAVSTVAQGLTQKDRLGVEIQPTMLKIRLVFQTFSVESATYNNMYRVIVFSYNRPEIAGSSPSSSLTRKDILMTGSQSNDDNLDVMCAPYNYENRANYKILFDQVVTRASVTDNQFAIKVITIGKNKLPHTIQWNDSGVTNPSKNKGHLYLFVAPLYQGDGSLSQRPQFAGSATLYYKDA